MRIYREDIKSGKGAAHEKVEAAYVRAFSKSAYPNYTAWVNTSGTSQAWFIERYDTYEAMEKANKVADAEPLKSTLDVLDAQDGELRTGERGIIATYQPDLSYTPVPVDLSKLRYISVNIIRVHLGHTDEFTEMRKLVNAAYAKGGNKQRRVIYAVNSGMPNGTYLVLSGMETLKSLDPPPGAMSMADAFGAANLARYNKLLSDIVIGTESTLFSVDPKMSNAPKEYIKSDPDFWAPKPKPAAAPAKTAAKAPGQQ